MITILKTLLLGIVEGITEWLPVSSTGHLILVNSFLPMDMSHEFMEMFDVVIQLGAILAVVVIYFNKLWPFHTKAHAPEKPVFKNQATDASGKSFQNFVTKYIYADRIVLWCKILVSVIPAIIIGLPLDDWLDAHLYNATVVSIMLIVHGVLFIIVEIYNARRKPRVNHISHITWKHALLIGIFQCLAMIPGTSRSGATIIGGIIIGLSRPVAAEYTFYLAIPTMFGASLLKLVKFGFAFSGQEIAILLLGSVTAFVVSMITIKYFMQFIRKHDFKPFGVYRIILGALVLILSFAGLVHA